MADLFGQTLSDLFNHPDYGVQHRFLVTVSNIGSISADTFNNESLIKGVTTFSQEFHSVIFPQKTLKTRTIPQLSPSQKRVVTGVTYSDLILKRGLVRENSFYQWVSSTIDSVEKGTSQAEWRVCTIQALDHRDLPMATWQATIRPRVYQMNSLHAMRSEVLIETIQCSVDNFERI